ncbi:MAG: hypothetical protein U9O53_03025, partial [archaeon]|nr:hypothetical protein [archaeon]
STQYVNWEKLIAPSSSTSFGIRAYPVDLYKNGDGSNDDRYVTLTTISQNTPGDDSGDSGDTPTGFIGGLIDNLLDDDKEEKEIRDFIFDTGQDELKIIQGESAELIAYLENTGDTDLNITVSYSLDCCTVEVNDSYFVKAKNKQSFTINLFSDLLEKPGTYKLKITMNAGNITKDKTLTVKIEKNQLIMMLESLENRFGRMEILVDDFDRLGINTSSYLEYIETSEMLIAKAYTAIASNDVQSLELAVSGLSATLDIFDARLAENELLKWLLENKYDLIKFAIVIILALLMIYSYLLPLFMLSFEYNQLKNKEIRLAEEEKSTEREYFKRIIDKTTFNKIITEKHEQLTDVRTRMTHIMAALKMLTHGHRVKVGELHAKLDKMKKDDGKQEKRQGLHLPKLPHIHMLSMIKSGARLDFIKKMLPKKSKAAQKIKKAPVDMSPEHPSYPQPETQVPQDNMPQQDIPQKSAEEIAKEKKEAFKKIKNKINNIFDDDEKQ